MRRFALITLALFALLSFYELGHAFLMFWLTYSDFKPVQVYFYLAMLLLTPASFVVVAVVQNWKPKCG